MSKRRLIPVLGAAIAALLGLFAAIGPASAGAIYRGGFDPILFFGTTEIYIPNSCFGTAYVVVANCQTASDPVNLLSVTVHDNPAPGTDSLTFVPPAAPAGTVLGLSWDSNGTLLAIDTTPFGPAFGSPGNVFTNSAGYDIQMVSGLGGQTVTAPHVNLFALSCGTEDDESNDRSFVQSDNNGGDDGGGGCRLSLVGNPANQFAFVRVPEPGSLALVLGALAAGAIVIRRRQQATSAAN